MNTTNQRPNEAERDWRPGYVRAAEDLRDRILNGEFLAGETIPSEPNLAQRYGISRTSVRNAVRQVREWGLVEARQGAGTYVLPRPTALFDGVLLDGRPGDEDAVTSALLALDPRYITCTPGCEPTDLIERGRIPIVHMGEDTDTPQPDRSGRWMNAMMWSAREAGFVPSATEITCILSIHTEATPPATAARAIHAVITAC